MLRPLFAIFFAGLLLAVPFISSAGGARASRMEEDAAVRAVLDSYLSTLTFPNPKTLDPAVFAEDIEAFWSTGDVYHGRIALAEAMATGIAQIGSDFESFKATPENVKIRRHGDLAWLTCGIDFDGVLKKDHLVVEYSVRSTFVLKQHEERWAIVHEHSSRPPVRK